MNQNTVEKRNRIFRFAVIGGLSLSFICALIVGFAFQFGEGLGYITSMGAPDDILQAAFIKGGFIGGLSGCLIGGLFGALIGAASK